MSLSDERVPVVLCGICGRMARSIALEALKKDSQTTIVAATVSPRSGLAGKDLGELLERSALGIYTSLLKDLHLPCDFKAVMVDFTSPAALAEHIHYAVSNRLALMVGTTGLDESHHKAMQAAASHIPIFYASNTSVGANLLAALAYYATEQLDPVEVEISEIHHRDKKDAPSGTALFLAQSICSARGQKLQEQAILDRSKQKRNSFEEIGIASLRGGSARGEHSIYFFGENETLILTHQATDRVVFAQGAMRAIRFLAKSRPGLYSMKDMLKMPF